MSETILLDRTWIEIWKMEPDLVNHEHAFSDLIPRIKCGLQNSWEDRVAAERRGQIWVTSYKG